MIAKICQKQKSQILWLKKGDKCTKFFHQMASIYKTNNTIEVCVIQDGGNILLEQEAIKDHLVNYQQNFLKEDSSWRPKLDEQLFDSIGLSGAIWLEKSLKKKKYFVVRQGTTRDHKNMGIALIFIMQHINFTGIKIKLDE